MQDRSFSRQGTQTWLRDHGRLYGEGSLAMVPATPISQDAMITDLDGQLLLAEDR